MVGDGRVLASEYIEKYGDCHNQDTPAVIPILGVLGTLGKRGFPRFEVFRMHDSHGI